MLSVATRNTCYILPAVKRRAQHLDWLLLMYSLPARRSSARVGLWRQLKKAGAVAFKTSTYILPDGPRRLERFQWMAKQVRDGGGDATLVHATDIEGTSDEEIVRMFDAARTEDYAGIAGELSRLIKSGRGKPAADPEAVEKLAARLEEVRGIDFFGSSRREEAEMLLAQARKQGRNRRSGGERLSARQFKQKLWVTRPRPEIDRVGSAWLIRRFIDPKARFAFSTRPADFPAAVTFDMVDGRFSHVGDDCTFETLLEVFRIDDPVARRMGEMVHAADLDDGKYPHAECIGIDRVLKGWARLGMSDEQLLARGAGLFDALHEFLRRGR
jgi:hypothetical protein